MKFIVGVERWQHGRTLIWVHDHPGCYAYAESMEDIEAVIAPAIEAYIAWVRGHGGTWLEDGEIEIEVAEIWEQYTINEAYDLAEEGTTIDAWFRHDWKPLSQVEVSRAAQILSWTRQELLALITPLDDDLLHQRYPGERWDIAGILSHVGGAEWWYLDRLGLAMPIEEVPPEPLERLTLVRQRLLEVLPTLADKHQVVGIEGEFWSPRKVLRRAVWHERDHINQIQGLLVRNAG